MNALESEDRLRRKLADLGAAMDRAPDAQSQPPFDERPTGYRRRLAIPVVLVALLLLLVGIGVSVADRPGRPAANVAATGRTAESAPPDSIVTNHRPLGPQGRVRLQAEDFTESTEADTPSFAFGARFIVKASDGEVTQSGAIGTYGDAILQGLPGTWTIEVSALHDGTPCGYQTEVTIAAGEVLTRSFSCATPLQGEGRP